MSDVSLEVRLRDLQLRITHQCAGDQRNLSFHWSDAELLTETLQLLRDQQLKLAHTATALTAAISMIR